MDEMRYKLVIMPHSRAVSQAKSTFRHRVSTPMRPKARGLAQHSGPPGWLEESFRTYKHVYCFKISVSCCGRQ